MDLKKTARVTITRLKRSFVVVCFLSSTQLEDEQSWSFDERILDRETKLFSNFNSCLFFPLLIFASHCCFSLFDLVVVSVPEPIALYPLNSEYQTREANRRQPMGTTGTDVSLAPGPEGEPLGSYLFSGQDDSYIEFPNDGGLNVKHSITMLCWVYMETSGVSGPLFSYNNSPWGIRLKVNSGKLRTRFKQNTKSTTDRSLGPMLWHYVGSSYNHETGKASLWLNGTKVKEEDIGAGITLATKQFVRMGVTARPDTTRFKGRITAMQVYNVALTAGQINKVKYAGRGRNQQIYIIRPCIFKVTTR